MSGGGKLPEESDQKCRGGGGAGLLAIVPEFVLDKGMGLS